MPIRRAFTLVEMLIVIFITATLVALLLPSLTDARKVAISAVCLSNQRQVLRLCMNYATDFKYLPPHGYEGSIDLSNGQMRGPVSRLVLKNYLDALPTIAGPGGYKLDKSRTRSDIRLCPAMGFDPMGEVNLSSDDFSHYLMPREVNGYYAFVDVVPLTPIRPDDIIKPMMTAGLYDCLIFTSGDANHEMLNSTWTLNWGNQRYYRSVPGLNNTGSFATTPPTWRHMGVSTNFTFHDGHGELRKWNANDPYSYASSSTWGGFGQLLGPLRGLSYDNL